jgi:hypothetical protein
MRAASHSEIPHFYHSHVSNSWVQSSFDDGAVGLTRALVVDRGRRCAVSSLHISIDLPRPPARLWITRSLAQVDPVSCHAYRLIEDIVFEPGSRLRAIDGFAFSWSALRRIRVPASVASIGASAFEFCKSLCEVAFEDGSQLQRIEREAFYSAGIRRIALPPSLTFLAGSAFVGVEFDVFLSLSASIVCDGPFVAQPALQTYIRYIGEPPEAVTIPPTVRVIAASCCSKCESLRELCFSGVCSVVRIEEKAFAWTNLRTVLIPRSVRVLAQMCFGWCRSLEEVLFEEDSELERIEAAFPNCALQRIVLPKAVRYVDGSAFLGNEGTLRSVESLSARIVMTDSFLIDVEEQILIRAVAPVGDFVCPREIRVVGKSCFNGSRYIRSAKFEPGSQLDLLDESAFYQSSLKQIVIPNSVISLRKNCCYGCMSLTDVTFEDNSRLERIEESAFCMASLRRIEIPRAVLVLGKCCLSWCEALVEVVVQAGSRMERIEDDAFTMSQVPGITIVHSRDTQLSFNRPGCEITVVLDG